jgi:arsenate reductase
VVPGKRYVSWQLPDPKNEPIERVREIRDEIERLGVELVAELDRSTVAAPSHVASAES